MIRIASWNIWCLNRDQIRSVNYILSKKPDVVCLQEVQMSTIEYLQRHPLYSCHYALDHIEKGNVPYYLVTLSRLPVLEVRKMQYRTKIPPTLLQRFNNWDESKEYLYVDVDYQGTTMRIFNCHLPLATGPTIRIKMFREITQFLTGHSVVAGDFNIFTNPIINSFIGWFLGFHKHDYYVYERLWFEKLFKRLELINTFAGFVTFPRVGLQLDHILSTNHDLFVKKSQVPIGAPGSDHTPLLADLVM